MNIETTILSSPDQGLTLDKDIRLVKLALLYSNKITLVSPKTSMIVGTIQLGDLTTDQKIAFLKKVGPIADPNFSIEEMDQMLEIVRKLNAKKIRSKEELVALGKFKSAIKQMDEELKGIAEKIYYDSNFEQLLPLIESGKLELKHFDFGMMDDGKFSEYMSSEIQDILKKSGSKYPVFDELMGNIAHQYSIENNIDYPKQKPKEIEFGKELILSLPNIDQISVDNMLKIKNELNNELSQFKGAILDYSKEINSNPFSEAAKVEMKKQYEYHIKPDLQALRNKVKQNKYLIHLTNEIMSNASTYVTQVGLFLGVCTLFDFEKLLSVSGVLGETTYKAYKKKAENTQGIKENQLFFYNELSRINN